MNYYLKTLFLLIFAAGATFAQTVTLNLQLQFQQPILQDVATYWATQKAGNAGALAAPVAATDTSIQVTLPGAQLVAATPQIAPATGQTLLIDGDAMTITSVSIASNVATLGVTRNVVPQFVAAAHAQGAAVYALAYSTPYMLAADALRKWAIGVSQNLGQQSAVFAATATGSYQ